MDLNLSNSFAALEVRKAKKKKQLDPSERKRRGEAKTEQSLRLEQQIFGNRDSNVSGDWADEEEDGWGHDPSMNALDGAANGKDAHSELHDSEEEIDLEELFGVELGPEEEHEEPDDKEKQETTGESLTDEADLLEEHRKKYQVQSQRKVSKKEMKKKEMEDLDDLLAGFGIDLSENQKTIEAGTKKKKKKNKEKTSTMADASEEAEQTAEVTEEREKLNEQEDMTEETSALTPEQIRNKLEKTKTAKKRASSKKSVTIAAAEAKARSKGKKGKKDQAHYNQAPNH